MKSNDIRVNGLDVPVNIPVEFVEGLNCLTRTLHPVDLNEPIAVHLVKSGWNFGYPTYHVIVEYGDFEQSDNYFMSAETIKKTFGIDVTVEESAKSLLIPTDLIKSNHNDADLGREVRKLLLRSEKSKLRGEKLVF